MADCKSMALGLQLLRKPRAAFPTPVTTDSPQNSPRDPQLPVTGLSLLCRWAAIFVPSDFPSSSPISSAHSLSNPLILAYLFLFNQRNRIFLNTTLCIFYVGCSWSSVWTPVCPSLHWNWSSLQGPPSRVHVWVPAVQSSALHLAALINIC